MIKVGHAELSKPTIKDNAARTALTLALEKRSKLLVSLLGGDISEVDARIQSDVEEERVAKKQLRVAVLTQGSDVNARDPRGNTPLHMAAIRGSFTDVEALLAAGSDINLQNSDGRTPLMLAVEQYNGSVVDVLISRGANTALRDKRGWTARDIAVRLHNTVIVAKLPVPTPHAR